MQSPSILSKLSDLKATNPAAMSNLAFKCGGRSKNQSGSENDNDSKTDFWSGAHGENLALPNMIFYSFEFFGAENPGIILLECYQTQS